MVAVRQFDEEEALDALMHAFWREGYGATSIEDLVAATGLKRGSLYAAFGDKEAMFLKALARYADRYERDLIACLERPAVETAVQELFEAVLANLDDPSTPPGCLLAIITSEAAGRGDAIERSAAASFETLSRRIEARLLQASAQGELVADCDARALSHYLAATLRGIAIVHRLTREPKTARDVARMAMQALRMSLVSARRA